MQPVLFFGLNKIDTLFYDYSIDYFKFYKQYPLPTVSN